MNVNLIDYCAGVTARPWAEFRHDAVLRTVQFTNLLRGRLWLKLVADVVRARRVSAFGDTSDIPVLYTVHIFARRITGLRATPAPRPTFP